MKKTIMIDFDGTITKQDTCVAVANEFVTRDWKNIDERWSNGELSTQQCSQMLFDLMDFDEKTLRSFLEKIEIDDYFIRFIEFCRKRNYDIYIVSDGFDFNIRTVLKKNKINNMEIYSNIFFFDDKGEYNLKFPHKSQDCGKCGTCKTSIYNKLKESSDKIIYIGDGYSDRCVAENADMLFAKSYLAQYCDEKEIEYIKYDSFKDVIDYLQK
ncbi:MtnX-like HAD-IB family phosphatase [Maledivibacter halophilus]|uniref:Haloacid Dehalogenase superfamily, subfamily IB, phosphoserine phosphatase-like/2,3-diketo-5-methylthio-1-phosphopentane phosphatase n=1 Tax=Maledivibacter halophilus TaxID=36842 RepID=A0A1T5M659_9FIRM|nr:MtnX-like HAD-IB family phosphatase [Maledivibacter halophilus]SKC83710.1 Haloacid Dehalogenase superfamily, subfamily IB, phosphoserine phosphatase-like/2,3-diketo-5-methylthio-1-phosphopentane phosphatase [Maledivibacter halophilus]